MRRGFGLGDDRLEDALRTQGDVRALDVGRSGQDGRDDRVVRVGRLVVAGENLQQDGRECPRSGRNDEVELVGLEKVVHPRIDRPPGIEGVRPGRDRAL